MNKKTLLLAAGLVSAVLAGCASKEVAKDVPVENRSTATTATTPSATTTSTTAIAPTTNVAVNPLKDPNNILSKRIIYFEYDQDSVKGE